MTSDTGTISNDVAAIDPFRWVAWPAAERKGRTTLLVLVVVVIGVLVGTIAGDWAWGATAGFILVVTLNRWFLPTVFEIKRDRIEVGYPLIRRAMPWNEVRLLAVAEQGGWISNKRSVPRFGSRRGFDLYWGPNPIGSLEAMLRAGQAVEASGVPLRIIDRREDGA